MTSPTTTSASVPRPRSGGTTTTYSSEELMSVAAARSLRDGQACLVGTGLPARAAELARRSHAPNLVLVHGSGAIDSGPGSTVLSLPEMLNYWLQPGRIDVGFLSGAQIDRFGNVNTTVLGEYDDPDERLSGPGSAPEIAAACGEVVIVMRHEARAFVEQVDFVTAVGFGSGVADRALLRLRGGGPSRVITDLGVLEPDPDTKELVLTALHPGVTPEQVRAETGWELQVSADLKVTVPPSETELTTLRAIGAE